MEPLMWDQEHASRWRASAIEVVDQEGRSVAAPDEPATTLWRYTVQDISGRLLVMEEEAIAQPC